MRNPSEQDARKNENIQILRFIAAALVLMTHITFYIHERVNPSVSVWRQGEIGVPIFFVISGLVMYLSTVSLERNSHGARKFLHRRISRIFPLYWLITTIKIGIALVVPAAVLHNKPDLLHALASYVLFPVFNAAGEIRPIHGVGWTLLHEMLFYYLFAVGLILRVSPGRFCSVVITALWILGIAVSPESAWGRVYVDKINLMFVAGIGLGWMLRHDYRPPTSLIALACIVALAFMGVTQESSSWLRTLYHYNAHAALAVFAVVFVSRDLPLLLKRWVVPLGDSSYALYLIHPILAPAFCVALWKLGVSASTAIALVAFVGSVIAAHLVYLWIERPLTRFAKAGLAPLLVGKSKFVQSVQAAE